MRGVLEGSWDLWNAGWLLLASGNHGVLGARSWVGVVVFGRGVGVLVSFWTDLSGLL